MIMAYVAQYFWGWLLAALLLGFAARELFALAKNFLEGTDFGKVHVARRAADLAIGSEILNPPVVGKELVRLGFEFFQADGVGDFMALPRRCIARQHDFLLFLASQGIR